MKRALFVGIDDYGPNSLTGCVNDALSMSQMLARHQDHSRNYEALVLSSDETEVTRPVLRRALVDLFDNARDAELLFYFSGHGAQTPWGSEIVTQDYQDDALGLSVGDVLTLANGAVAREITVILDCCYSGDLGNLPELTTTPSSLFGKAVLRENVVLLVASRPTEGAFEEGGHGAFTRLLLEGLDGAAADHLGEVTALSLYAFVSRSFGAWDQRPMFKGHLTTASCLRRCRPPIDSALLRRLPEVFTSADQVIALQPEHEGTRPIPEGIAPTALQGQFDYFKELRNASLLSVDDGKDLYYAAVEGGSVRLTAVGRYFWSLASDGRL